MCFSAGASFSIAAVTTVIGVATLSHVKGWRELPLASIPLLFAIQQAIEGELWLRLTAGSSKEAVAALSLIFVIFAKVLWPAFTSFAVLLVEPDVRFENEKHEANVSTQTVIKQAFEGAGVRFSEDGGVLPPDKKGS